MFLILIASLLFAVTGIYYLWILTCVIIGLCTKKQPQKPAPPLRIAVLSCARNEEAVISGLIDSIQKQDYPPDCRKMFVVAHNCTDHTAQLAAEAGEEVLVRNDPNDTCKGDAMRFGVGEILRRYPGAFDAIAVFDADNLASRGFLREISAALHHADVVQGFRASKNYHFNWVSELFAAFWLCMSDFQYLAHTRMNLPSCVNGTGFAFRVDALPPEGWQTVTFLEDVEFSVRQTLSGHRVRSAPLAVFYDEQPVKLLDGLRQRFRWAVGMQETMRHYAPALLRSLPKLGWDAVKTLGDICINPIFTCTILGLIFLFSGLWLGGTSAGALLMGLLIFMLSMWLLSLPIALGLLRKEREPIRKNLSTVFLFAPFLFLSFVFGVAAIFVRKPKWTPIQHGDTTSISDLEQTDR